MAEVIGLTASIIGIVGAAAKLSTGLYKVASALKNAGNEVRIIASDTLLFSRVLREFSTSLKADTAVAHRARGIAEDLTEVCQGIQKNGEELLEILGPLISKTDRSRHCVSLRIRWLFQRSKFLWHRDALSSLKGSLQLIISVIQMSKETDEHMLASLFNEVESLRHFANSGIGVLRANLDNPTLARILSSRPMDRLEADEGELTAELSPSQLYLENTGPESRSESVEDISRNDDLEQGSSGALEIFDKHDKAVSNGDFVSPLALILYFRILFVQEKAFRFAGQIVEGGEYTQGPNLADSPTEATDQSPTSRPPSDVNSTRKSDLRTPSPERSKVEMGQRAMTDGNPELGRTILSEVEQAPITEAAEARLSSHLSSESYSRSDQYSKSKPHSRSSSRVAEAEVPTSADSAYVPKENGPFRRTVPSELPSPRTPHLIKSIGRTDTEDTRNCAPVKFTDAAGRIYTVPFHLARSLEIEGRKYELLGEHGEIILPNFYEELISPGLRISMRLCHATPSVLSEIADIAKGYRFDDMVKLEEKQARTRQSFKGILQGDWISRRLLK
ncbi:MAG: hypothetical protein M1821_008393 [Bathelium mastoideum]|nr:MAG: hypothetical protein M1821_008393 [Bathelium mastoideum]